MCHHLFIVKIFKTWLGVEIQFCSQSELFPNRSLLGWGWWWWWCYLIFLTQSGAGGLRINMNLESESLTARARWCPALATPLLQLVTNTETFYCNHRKIFIRDITFSIFSLSPSLPPSLPLSLSLSLMMMIRIRSALASEPQVSLHTAPYLSWCWWLAQCGGQGVIISCKFLLLPNTGWLTLNWAGWQWWWDDWRDTGHHTDTVVTSQSHQPSLTESTQLQQHSTISYHISPPPPSL